jgi:hypothetical protein
MSGTLLIPSAIRAQLLQQLISDTLPASPIGEDGRLALLYAQPGGEDNPTLADVEAVELSAAGYLRQIPVWTTIASDQAITGTLLDEAAIFGPFTDEGGSGVKVSHIALVTATDCVAVWQTDYAVGCDRNESIAIPEGSLELDLY